MNYLCDTNVISELVRQQPNQGVIQWFNHVERLFLSVITVEELYFGLTKQSKPKVQTALETILLSNRIEILPITNAIAQCAGQWRGNFENTGQIRTQADMLIAATAYIHQLTLVTRNIRDFTDCDISILNPFI